ncbi:MAG: class I SAM-dependent methyltransferase [Acidobacteria bacterium]|nr:MAG: class I SAM-dependent methyltransferase [Acidobacteriota bacterium]RPJ86882.1 MAG: class I SAM-dependent methyltransferase [Acidobacteriota bacterium]
MKSVVTKSRRWLSSILPYQPMDGRKETLEAEYRGGTWDYLRQKHELSRFSVVVGYCHHFKPGAAILEVGCGEGILQERLDRSRYSRYVGIDISAEAIRRACGKQDAKTSFIAADATVFEPHEEFDLIVFNECLEYFPDPLALVHRYERFLRTAGLYVVSIFNGIETARSKRIWKMLQSVYAVECETQVSNGLGYTWTIKVLKPEANESHE